MARLPILTVDTAPEAVRPLLEKSHKAMGFLPNFVGMAAQAPAALEAYMTVSGLNMRTSLNPGEREVVQLVAGTTHGCHFCVAAHTPAALGKGKLPQAVVDALRAGQTLPDAHLEALARFARSVIATRGDVPDAELQAFRAAGFTDQQALEVVLGISLATLSNFANNLAHTPLNAELQPYAWQRPAA